MVEIEIERAHPWLAYRGVIDFQHEGRFVRRRAYDPSIWNLVRRLVERMHDFPAELERSRR